MGVLSPAGFPCIGLKLAGWQLLQIYVGLNLAVGLLAFAMGMVESNDFVVSHSKVIHQVLTSMSPFRGSAPYLSMVRFITSYPVRIFMMATSIVFLWSVVLENIIKF